MNQSKRRKLSPRERRQKLRHGLGEGASRYAVVALGDHLDKRWEDYFLHAGMALELMAKAYLASLDTSFIADAKTFDSLLHAAGRGELAKPRTRLRTIGAAEAISRVGIILPAVANEKAELAELIEARNEAAHLGSIGETTAQRTMLAWFRATREMLGQAGWDESAYWGAYTDMVTTRLSESADAAKVVVAELMVAAKRTFEQRYGSLDEETRTAVLLAVQPAHVSTTEAQIADCPACGTPAMLDGHSDVEWQPDVDFADGEAYVSGVYPDVTFYPAYLFCKACGLELGGLDELMAAGLQDSFEVDDPKINEEFLRDFYTEDH